MEDTVTTDEDENKITTITTMNDESKLQANSNDSKLMKLIQGILFSEGNNLSCNQIRYRGMTLVYILAQIFLLFLLFVFTQGAFTVITRFMFTYLVKGTAKFDNGK